MFMILGGIWGEGDESHGPCVGRLASNLWLQEYGVEAARSILGMPPGEHPSWCPEATGYIVSRR